MTKTQAIALTGGLSNPSKMPGRGFGLPAAGAACPVGSKLAKVPGTVCSGCYAVKGFYGMSNVQAAQALRFDLVKNALADTISRDKWVAAMTRLITDQTYFRWHDSGDVFSLEYLELIVDVVKATPKTRHWLPTRELMTVRQYQKKHGAFPNNMTVRLSLPRIDASVQDAAKVGLAFGLPTSTVATSKQTCPAPTQGNECKSCRACWNRNVLHVSYLKH